MPIYSQMSLSRLAGLRPLLFASGSTSIILLRCIVAEYTKKPLGTWADKLKNRYSSNKNEQTEGTKESSLKSSEIDNGGRDQESEPLPSGYDIESLKQVLKEKEELLIQKEGETKDVKDKYMRALAEIENTRQRMQRQVDDAKLFGIQDFSKDMLDVADVLEKAIETVPQTELQEGVNPSLYSLFVGLRMTETQLQKVFQKNGLLRIDPLGEIFDPKYHEALLEVPGEKPGTIGMVSKVGYVLNGRTIRPALVGVVKAQENNDSKNI